MNLSEQIAKAVVEHILPGSTMQYRLNQSAGEYDFDLKHADGKAPLEVTMAANQKRLETIGAITNKKKGDQFVEAVECSNRWHIYPLPYANINKIRASIDAYLVQIEAEGFRSFFAEFDHVKSQAIKKILRDLKIEAGYVFQNGERQIYIELPGQWGPVTPDYLQHAVKAEASKEDNRKKLGANPHGEGHLFVYVDMDNFLLWKALVDEMLPTEPPQLPKEISHVWVAAPTGSPSEYIVYRSGRGERWENPVRIVIKDQS